MSEYSNKPDKKVMFLAVGLALMVIAVLLMIFLRPLDGPAVTGIILMLIIGFGCCVAGTEPKDLER